jgi:hypothetical protein
MSRALQVTAYLTRSALQSVTDPFAPSGIDNAKGRRALWRGSTWVSHNLVDCCSITESATGTHLPLAPSKRHRSFAPSRIGNANRGASCAYVVRSHHAVRSQTPTPRASCVAGHTCEAVSPKPHASLIRIRLSQISGIFST